MFRRVNQDRYGCRAVVVATVVVAALAVVLFQVHAGDAGSRDRARGGQQAAQREGAQGGEEGVAVTSHAVLSERAPEDMSAERRR